MKDSTKKAVDKAIDNYRDDMADAATAVAIEAHISGDIAAHAAMGIPIGKMEVQREALLFGRKYKKLLKKTGGTIIQGKRIDWLASHTEDTRKAVYETIRAGLIEGKPVADIGGKLSAPGTVAHDLEKLIIRDAKYKYVRIARTETAAIQNQGTLNRFKKNKITHVGVIDGTDFDEACAEANGQIWTVEYAASHELEHPNCTRSFSPVIPDDWVVPDEAKLVKKPRIAKKSTQARPSGLKPAEVRPVEDLGSIEKVILKDVESGEDLVYAFNENRRLAKRYGATGDDVFTEKFTDHVKGNRMLINHADDTTLNLDDLKFAIKHGADDVSIVTGSEMHTIGGIKNINNIDDISPIIKKFTAEVDDDIAKGLINAADRDKEVWLRLANDDVIDFIKVDISDLRKPSKPKIKPKPKVEKPKIKPKPKVEKPKIKPKPKVEKPKPEVKPKVEKPSTPKMPVKKKPSKPSTKDLGNADDIMDAKMYSNTNNMGEIMIDEYGMPDPDAYIRDRIGVDFGVTSKNSVGEWRKATDDWMFNNQKHEKYNEVRQLRATFMKPDATEMRSVIYNSEKATVGYLPDTGIKMVDDADALMKKLTNKRFRDADVQISYSSGPGRASYNANSRTLSLFEDSNKRTVLHEFGHAIEDGDKIFAEAMKSLRLEKSGSKKSYKLSDLTGNRGYGPSERALKDDFIDPYAGRVYSHGSTEMLSMGLEQFNTLKSATDFYITHPDHFHAILKVLK